MGINLSDLSASAQAQIMRKGKNMEIECDNCKKPFKTYPCYLKRKRKNHFCSRKCEAKFKSLNNTVESWSGGHISTSTGYKYVRYGKNIIEEHRLVMMKKMGRELKEWECVHHINGNKLDNRIENLILTTRWDHPHYHTKNNTVKCLKCGEIKHHHARGLCDNCYHCALLTGRLLDYAK